MRILAIETSCDETSAAILDADGRVRASIVSSQVEHLEFGGVVPEIAARAHLRQLRAIVSRALGEAGCGLGEVEGVAATQGPGLIGALLVGFGFGRALALARGIPFVGVNHIEGHLLSPLLEDPQFRPPFAALIASGGHTEFIHSPEWHRYRILGSTLDDAVGEAFDKVASILGLGYPGGPAIQRIAAPGDPAAFPFPRVRLRPGSLDVSLSGLKTAVRLAVEARRRALGLPADAGLPLTEAANLAASFQAAVVEVLAEKMATMLRVTGAPRLVLAGGVAANGALRAAASRVAETHGVPLHVPALRYCGDNAAMIGAVGRRRLLAGERAPRDARPVASLSVLGL